MRIKWGNNSKKNGIEVTYSNKTRDGTKFFVNLLERLVDEVSIRDVAFVRLKRASGEWCERKKTIEYLGFNVELLREFLCYLRGVLGRPLSRKMIRINWVNICVRRTCRLSRHLLLLEQRPCSARIRCPCFHQWRQYISLRNESEVRDRRNVTNMLLTGKADAEAAWHCWEGFESVKWVGGCGLN